MARKVTYGFAMSLDGYIADRDGIFEWATPAPDVHKFFNDETARSDLFLYGRTIWELMNDYWATADEQPDASPVSLEFARLWQKTPKVVFSRTLESPEALGLKEKSGDVSLVREDAIGEVKRLRELPGGEIQVGGADFAASLIAEDLIDEYVMVIHPIIVGGGKAFLPPMDHKLRLELMETIPFEGGVVGLRYIRRR